MQVTKSGTTTVSIRPLDQTWSKQEVDTYKTEKPVLTNVTQVVATTWTLIKYAPPNSVWADPLGNYCVCPSNPASAPATAVVTNLPAPAPAPAPITAPVSAALNATSLTAALTG
jgi:hypothetical protein